MPGTTFLAGGGQGDDVLSQVDSMIDGHIMTGTAHSRRAESGSTPGPTLVQTLADGIRDLLGGEPARRHRRENDLFRGTTRQPQNQVIPPAAGGPTSATPLQTNPDGSLRSPSQQLLEGLMDNFGFMG